MIPSAALKPLIGLGLALLSAAAGMWAGYDLAQTQAEAARSRAAAQALKDLQAEQQRGAAAVDAVNERLREQRRYESQLQQEIAHVRLVHIRRAPAGALPAGHPAGGCGGGAGLLAPVVGDRTNAHAGAGQPPGAADSAPLGGPPGAADAQAPQPDDVDGSVVLTLDAVRLWNSALAGVDVPAGACRADAAGGAACAADAGLGLDDAWRNHAANAAACHRLRLRHDALVALLRQRQAQPSVQP